ncbi:hypothetical protein DP73_18505 [Desulfosporosinus sp. HMP52]|nr:hypothetical protein DP73_18505 [Desulfosporosinus sp. HMP52]
MRRQCPSGASQAFFIIIYPRVNYFHNIALHNIENHVRALTYRGFVAFYQAIQTSNMVYYRKDIKFPELDGQQVG